MLCEPAAITNKKTKMARIINIPELIADSLTWESIKALQKGDRLQIVRYSEFGDTTRFEITLATFHEAYTDARSGFCVLVVTDIFARDMMDEDLRSMVMPMARIELNAKFHVKRMNDEQAAAYDKFVTATNEILTL